MGFATLLLALAGASVAVRGQVVDEDTKDPVRDAIIVLPELPNKDDLIAVTDAAGRFAIEGPRGTHLVEVQREGYSTLRRALEFGSQDFVLAIRACPRGLPPFDRLEPGQPESFDRVHGLLLSLGSLDSPPALGVLIVAPGRPEETMVLGTKNRSPAVVAAQKTVPISARTAAQIRSLWRMAFLISRTDPTHSCSFGLPTEQRVSAVFFLGDQAAFTVGPERGTKIADLVAIAEQLAALPRADPTDRAASEAHLSNDVDSLLTRFGLPLTPP